jgi:hypothetical protein
MLILNALLAGLIEQQLEKQDVVREHDQLTGFSLKHEAPSNPLTPDMVEGRHRVVEDDPGPCWRRAEFREERGERQSTGLSLA